MRRNRFLVVMHSLFLAGLFVLAVKFAATHDAWRMVGAVFAWLCLWLVRDDLTRNMP